MCSEERCGHGECSEMCSKGTSDPDKEPCGCRKTDTAVQQKIDKKDDKSIKGAKKGQNRLTATPQGAQTAQRKSHEKSESKGLCGFFKAKLCSKTNQTTNDDFEDVSTEGLDPPCSNAFPADGRIIGCNDNCLYQEVCAKYLSTIMSNMSTTRSGFTVNVRKRTCSSCEASTSCQNNLCYTNGQKKKRPSECAGSPSSYDNPPSPCTTVPCPKRKLFRM